MRASRYLLLLLAALAAIPSANAATFTYCVDTTSDTNLGVCSAVAGDCSIRGAFNTGELVGEGHTVEIRIPTGTYLVDDPLVFSPSGDKDAKSVYVTGGWNSGCSSRNANPAGTTLQGNADTYFGLSGDLTEMALESLTLRNFYRISLNDPACPDLEICSGTQTVRMRYMQVLDSGSVNITARDALNVNVVNNLIARTGGVEGNAGLALWQTNAGANVNVSFNTFADMDCGQGAAVRLNLAASGAPVHHNIFQSNCSNDLYFGDEGAALLENLYETRGGATPTSNSGNLVENDPGFVNPSALVGDFKLKESAPLSPAINAGMTQAQAALLGVPSQDLDGPAGGRLVGANYDMGAFESTIPSGSVFTVTNTSDANVVGSLRNAIIGANATAGTQTIVFNITGSCTSQPHVITLSSALPDLIDSVVIDGYTEPGSSPNSQETGSDARICVVLQAGANLTHAIKFANAPNTASLTLRGIGFAASIAGNFSEAAVLLQDGQSHAIQGNAFGGLLPTTGVSLLTLIDGISISANATSVTVGGTQPEDRNYFGDLQGDGVSIAGTGSNHVIQNNYIGVQPAGLIAQNIAFNGIFASGSVNTKILDNVIASADSAGVRLSGSSTTGFTIQRNRIGLNALGIPATALRNGIGILVTANSANHLIGATSGLTPSNLISNNQGAGVEIESGTGTTVRTNRIYANGKSGSGLGVDHFGDGQGSNDPGDGDSGPDNQQNFATILSSVPNADGSRTVTVSLNSTSAQNFRVDLYRAPSCPGGDLGADLYDLLGGGTLTTSAHGSGQAQIVVPGDVGGSYLSALTYRNSTGDTSEPSLCFQEPKLTTTQIVADSPDASAIGATYTVQALVSAASGTPTGDVTFSDGEDDCTASLSGGVAACQLLSLSVGSKTVTATYAGNASYAASSDTEAHTVAKAATTTTIIDDPEQSEAGQPYTVHVQVRTPQGNLAIPDGTVTISDGNGVSCLSPITLNQLGDGACILTANTTGNRNLSASYSGNSEFLASNDTELHVVVGASTETTIVSDLSLPSAPGQSYPVSVTVSALFGTPTGHVAISDNAGADCQFTLDASLSGSCDLVSANAGPKQITATYFPDNNVHASSGDSGVHVVQAATTQTVIGAVLPATSIPGESYSVTALVSDANGQFNGVFGTVSISNGDDTCEATISNGTGSCSLVSLSAGQKLLTACLQGNASYSPSCGNALRQIGKGSVSIDSMTIDPATPLEGATAQAQVQISMATGLGTPTGTVTVVATGGAQCVITLPATTCDLVFDSAGNHNVSFQYSGDDNFHENDDSIQVEVVADSVFANGFD